MGHSPQVFTTQQIIFFDGVCGLCNTSVNWLMKRDKKGVLKFATLQGETAKTLLPHQFTQELNSFIYFKNQTIHSHSNAALYALQDLSGVWFAIAKVLFIFPKNFRDAVYNFVAKRRYKWFGKKSVCRIPTAEERDKFLP
jgi:predicted DCC family thiol-disulfide oxidoreductase YuxK